MRSRVGCEPTTRSRGAGVLPLFPGWLLTGTYSRALRGSLQEAGMEQEECSAASQIDPRSL